MVQKIEDTATDCVRVCVRVCLRMCVGVEIAEECQRLTCGIPENLRVATSSDYNCTLRVFFSGKESDD